MPPPSCLEDQVKNVSCGFYQVKYHLIGMVYDFDGGPELKEITETRIIMSVSKSTIQAAPKTTYNSFLTDNKMAIEDIEEFKKDKKTKIYQETDKMLIITRISQISHDTFMYREPCQKVISKHLSKQLWKYMKKEEEKIECPVSLEPIIKFENFVMLGCGHHISKQTAEKLVKKICPICQKHQAETWETLSWYCSVAPPDEEVEIYEPPRP